MERHEKELVWKLYFEKRNESERDALIESYLFLVKWIVGRMAATLPSHIKLDDLYSSGITGLMKAVERFDPTKNAKFETYASFLIKGAILDELRKLDWVPRSVHQKINQVQAAQSALQQELGRDPTDLELSKYMNINETELCELLERIRPMILISLNSERGSPQEESLSEKIADVNAELSSDVLHRKEFANFLEGAVNALPEQEKQVLVLYYYEELMLKEIGKIMGVSESRVSQIHAKALLKLRAKLQKVKEQFALQ